MAHALATPLRRVVGLLTALLMVVVVVAFATGEVGRSLDDLGELGAALLASISCASASRSAAGRVRAGGDSVLGVAVSVAYPMSDIALLVVCVLVLSRSRSHRIPLAFVAAGLTMMAVSDSGFAYLTANGSYATGNPVDLGWFFAFA